MPATTVDSIDIKVRSYYEGIAELDRITSSTQGGQRADRLWTSIDELLVHQQLDNSLVQGYLRSRTFQSRRIMSQVPSEYFLLIPLQEITML